MRHVDGRCHAAVATARAGARRDGRFHGPYLRDELLTRGVLVDTLETATTWGELLEVYLTHLKKVGFFRPDGSKNTAAVARAVALASGATGTCLVCNGTGQVRPIKSVECRGEKVKIVKFKIKKEKAAAADATAEGAAAAPGAAAPAPAAKAAPQAKGAPAKDAGKPAGGEAKKPAK